MKSRVLVTGGLGFIGSHVAELLRDELYDVMVIDDLSTGNMLNRLEGINYVLGSIGESKVDNEVLKYRPNFIFHLAALPRIQPSFENPIQHNRVNIDATVHLLELARQFNLNAFVYSSSASVYGNPEHQPITENTRIAPLSPYAVQKYAGERLSLLLGERWNLPVVSLRYFNPFGERSFHENNKDSAYSPVVGIFESNIKSGRKLRITGEGSQRRDFIYVKDVARANLLSAIHIKVANQNIFNVCSGETHSILEVAQMFGGECEFIAARAGEADVSWGCKCKISKLLQWKPSLTLEDYISKFCREA